MSRFSLTAAVALLALALSASAAPATAAEPEPSRRVVLLQTPAALERALRTALMPWGMRVARSQARAQPRPPKNPEQARSLARRLRADALVWLAPALKRHELWLYDGANGTLTTRSVPRPPFDETRAAALALSVKTELRKGTLADATPVVVSDVAAKSVAPAGKEDATALPAPAASELAASEPAADEPPEREPVAPDPAPAIPEPPAPAASPIDTGPSDWTAWDASEAPRWKLVLHGSARLGATTLGGSEGRYALEGRWGPWADPSTPATLWLSARVDLGLPRAVGNGRFTGEYSEYDAGLGLGASVRLNRWFEVGVQASAALRTGRVSGTLTEDTTPGDRTLFGLDLHLRPELELSLGTLGILLQPAVGASPTRQRYEADDVEVLETRSFWWQLGAGVRVAID